MQYKIDIPEEVKRILNHFESYNYRAYIVGGCVRDFLLGRFPKDWDICTDAEPEKVKQLFKKEKVIETGLKHGTVTVVLSGRPYEITTMRIDGEYSDKRRPDWIEYTNNLTKDLGRRDFTINAMAYHPNEGLIDPYYGVIDLVKRRINCVGPPLARLSEDPLRILRAIRFAAELNFKISPSTQKSMIALAEKLRDLSAERINAELCRIFSVRSICGGILKDYKDIFFKVIPELLPTKEFHQNNPYHIYCVFLHTCKALEHGTNDLICNLALLFHDIGKPQCYTEDSSGIGHFYGHSEVGAKMTDEIMRRLKFDNKTRESVVDLVRYHDSELPTKKAGLRKWLNKLGEEQLERLIKIKRCDIEAQNPIYAQERIEKLSEIYRKIYEILEAKECFCLPKVP